jgi:group II intron reverse transcriptase/maturase
VNYVIDADIKGFFDNVNHEWMKRCIEERISDKKFVRYIVRFLKSGIVEEGKYIETEKGTPQGGIVSPVLANIYLHYILDLWFEKKLKRYCKGYVDLARYADDFLVSVQREEDTEMILKAIKQRFEKFGLELSEEKTQVVKFGRYWKESDNDTGSRTGTFNFLGFTHYCGYSRRGRFKVCRKTEKKRFCKGIKRVNNWMRSQRNRKQLKELWQMMCWVLNGHYRYYGVNDNYKMIYQFYFAVKRIMYKWINRRSQKKSLNWDNFQKYLDRFPLPRPKIYNNLYKYAFYWEQQ